MQEVGGVISDNLMQNTSVHDLDDEEGEMMMLLEAAIMILFPHDPPPLSADNVSVFVALMRQL